MKVILCRIGVAGFMQCKIFYNITEDGSLPQNEKNIREYEKLSVEKEKRARAGVQYWDISASYALVKYSKVFQTEVYDIL